MERNPQQVVQWMHEIEELAEDVLSDRQQIVELDRKRNQIREATRAVYKSKDSGKLWVCHGNQFIKLPKHQTKKFLNQDSDELDDEINSLRRQLKQKVNKLQDLEHKEELKGFHLNPLSKKELTALNDIL